MSSITYQKIILVIIISLFTISGQSQMKQKVADRLYNELAYYKAVELYEDLAKKSKATAYQIRRTAECYKELGDFKSSEKWYGKLVGNNEAAADDFYNYAQSLKSNEKYTEANVQMERFYEKANDNSIAVAHHNDKDYDNTLRIHADRYEIEHLKEVNTKDSDFGTNYYKINGKEGLVFASSRRNMNAMNKEFQWDGSNFLDLYTVTLDSEGQGKSPGKFNKDIRSKYHEGPISFSNEGTKMYLTRSNYLDKKKGLDNKKHNNLKLYLSQLKGDEWLELTEFKYNSDDYSVGHATVTEDGSTMYFISDMPTPRAGNDNKNKGETDIWKSVKKLNGEWGIPENVKSVNTEGKEMFPYIGKTGVLYFASNGHVGLGGLDLYRAEPKDSGFSVPMNMGYPLNTNHDDFAFIVNANETVGYVSSNRIIEESKGQDDIYKVNILYPFGPKLYTIKGAAINNETEEKMIGVVIKVINEETGDIVASVITDEKGNYTVTGVPEGKYKVVGEKENFDLVAPYTFNTDDIDDIRILEDVNVRMMKNDCGLIGAIADAESGTPLQNVKITLTNKTRGKVTEIITDANGGFKDPLTGAPCPGGTINYVFMLEKEGYFSKEVSFKFVITKSGIINLNQYLKMTLQNKTGTVNKYCEIEDILFDFDKSNIRRDASVELDKLVACMKKHPEMRIEIGAHTDCRGSGRYNRKLSDRRAKSSMKYVISRGISADRIFGQGYGEDNLLNECECEGSKKSRCSEEEHQINRRTEFKLVGEDDGVKNNSTDSFDK
jgi:outer membrane protein OmpA-like peptidoglycan-associated protein/5-hydroxyisourate hydrolase-like protein (transthyretin family)